MVTGHPIMSLIDRFLGQSHCAGKAISLPLPSGILNLMTGAIAGSGPADDVSQRWDVALSFAGAQREYVAHVAAALKARGVRCFYDADEQVRLWGTHLAEELPRIYARQAAAVVVFVSADYAAGDWTRLERRAAFSQAVAQAGVYVLPARFDDSKLEGLLPDVVYVDLSRLSPGQFADLIVEKLTDLAIRPPLVSSGVHTDEADPQRLDMHMAIGTPAASDDLPPEYRPPYSDVAQDDTVERPDDRSYRSMCRKYLEWAANEWRYIDLGDLGAEPDAPDSDRVRTLSLRKMYISLQADPRSVADRRRQESLRRMDQDELDIDVARRMSRQENLDAVLARGRGASTGEGAGRAGWTPPEEAGISLEDAFARHPVLVVLGVPGSGKSVLCLWLGLEVARETREALAYGGTGRIRIPMLFRAADYAKFYERELARGERPGGVGRFLASTVHKPVGYPARMLHGMFERALADQEAVLLIDGLDELTDHRNEVIDALAAMVTTHVAGGGGGHSQAVITSRVAGYDDVYLTIDDAAHYLIRPMTQEQVETFAHRFFAELGAADQAPQLLRHLADSTSDVVRRLASTPLLLTSMCSYWYRHHELPASRPALYRQLVLDTAFRWRGFAA